MSAPAQRDILTSTLNGQRPYNAEFTVFLPTLFISARVWQTQQLKREIPLPVYYSMPISFGKIKLYFLSFAFYVFFSINFVMEVRFWLRFFHVCLQSRLDAGQDCGTLAHNMESLSKESSINAPRGILPQNILIAIMFAASLRT